MYLIHCQSKSSNNRKIKYWILVPYSTVQTNKKKLVFMSWGCQSTFYWLFDNFGLPWGRFCPYWQPGAARVHLFCSVTAWGCQGAHNGLCDSLGWQGADFAFSASFLILNKIMPSGRCVASSNIWLGTIWRAQAPTKADQFFLAT